MVTAFKVRAGVFGPWRSDLFALSAQAISWPAEFIPDAKVQTYVLTWALAMAERRSVRELERGLGWSRSTTHRKRAAAFKHIADRLNRAGVEVW
jgi:hypothetical protein